MGTTNNVQCWDTTPSSNENADGGVGAVNGNASPGVVDDWIRALMASLKKYSRDQGGAITSGGTADALTITTNQSISSGHQAAGFSVRFKAGLSNTGAATVAVDGLSAVAIKRMNGDALVAGDIIAGGVYDLAFDGTNYKLMGSGTVAGALSGDNTWTGANVFQGSVTVGDGAGDVVVIKGTTVHSYMSGLFATSSVGNLRSALSLGTAALKNTGTSGDAVPLLNVINSWTTQLFTSTTQNVSALSVTNSASAATCHLVQFVDSVGEAGSIRTTAPGVSITYNTTSDGRIKPEKYRRRIEDSGEIIDAIEPIYFQWAQGGDEDFGYVAQELARVPVAGRIVSPGDDDPNKRRGDNGFVPWQMPYGRLEPILIAELKHLRQRVSELEAGNY